MGVNRDLSKHGEVTKMSERQARKRRKLEAMVPADAKKKMKQELHAIWADINNKKNKLKAERNKELAELHSRYDKEFFALNDEYEERRAKTIEYTEQKYGVKGVAA